MPREPSPLSSYLLEKSGAHKGRADAAVPAWREELWAQNQKVKEAGGEDTPTEALLQAGGKEPSLGRLEAELGREREAWNMPKEALPQAQGRESRHTRGGFASSRRETAEVRGAGYTWTTRTGSQEGVRSGGSGHTWRMTTRGW